MGRTSRPAISPRVAADQSHHRMFGSDQAGSWLDMTCKRAGGWRATIASTRCDHVARRHAPRQADIGLDGAAPGQHVDERAAHPLADVERHPPHVRSRTRQMDAIDFVRAGRDGAGDRGGNATWVRSTSARSSISAAAILVAEGLLCG